MPTKFIWDGSLLCSAKSRKHFPALLYEIQHGNGSLPLRRLLPLNGGFLFKREGGRQGGAGSPSLPYDALLLQSAVQADSWLVLEVENHGFLVESAVFFGNFLISTGWTPTVMYCVDARATRMSVYPKTRFFRRRISHAEQITTFRPFISSRSSR